MIEECRRLERHLVTMKVSDCTSLAGSPGTGVMFLEDVRVVEFHPATIRGRYASVSVVVSVELGGLEVSSQVRLSRSRELDVLSNVISGAMASSWCHVMRKSFVRYPNE